jgi:DNA-binding transcriptional regulator/RsmH inhibitor MraZ
MADGGTEQTIRYAGFFKHNLDTARRIQIPNVWRPKDDGTVTVFVQLRSDPTAGKYLRVLSAREFDRLEAEYADKEKNGRRDPVNDAYRADTFENLEPVVLDSAGRLALGPDWAKALGLESRHEVGLRGLSRFFEVWNLKSLEVMRGAEAKLRAVAEQA